MKRRGFTIILVLIICAVCFPILLFAWQTLLIQAKLNTNRMKTIQGELYIETEINKMIYNQTGINDSIIGSLTLTQYENR